MVSLQARRIGETQAQYNRRVGKRPPTTVRRPTTTKQKPVTPTVKKPPTQKVKARVDPVKRQPIRKKPTVDPDRRQPTRRLPKGKPIASIDYFDKDGKRVIVRQDDPPTRRTPRPKRPTVDPKKNIQAFIDSYIPKGPTTPRPKRPPTTPRPKRPPTTPRPKRPPKNLQALIEELKRRQKDKPKRPRVPTPKPVPKGMEVVPEGYKNVSFKDAGFKPPPKGSATTSALVRFYNPKTKEVVVVPSGGYTPAKGFIRSGSLGGPLDPMPRVEPPRPQPLPFRPMPFAETQPVRRPPDPLGGRDLRDLNRKERAEVIKARYQLSQTERMRNYNIARQNLINRFRNDPAKLRQELSKLNINIRQDDTVRKFRAGLVNRNALNNIGLPPREIQKVIFDRRMSVMPESPRKLDMILNFQIREMNLDLRETIKKMQARGATRQEIQRIRTAYRNEIARRRQNMARAKADLQAYRRTR